MAKKKRKTNGISAEPVYGRQIAESDLLWLVEEYRKQVNLDPNITVDEFAQQHGIETKLLSQYIFEPGSRKGGITLWHGTTVARAQAIVEEGFRAKGGETGGKKIWFTRNPNEARRIAQHRANQRGEEPVVFQCQIDLWDYDEYDRPNPNHYAFKHHTISNVVINRTEGLKREKIRELKTKERKRQLVDVDINKTSNELVMVYWINSYLKLEGESAVSMQHPAIKIIQAWVNNQYSEGRETPISDEEMLHLVMIFMPEYFEWK
ncbi:hypothetical protein FJZ31_42995 [Candidatus Poribacteria bacterium]|nr:hypothetical protein [Candidatus Poribacteria bacterium]